MLKKFEFKVEGVHCKSCKTLIETEVDVLEGVKDVKLDYRTGDCVAEFDEEKISFNKIKEKIESFDYKVLTGGVSVGAKKGLNSFWIGLGIPLILVGIIGGYYLIQKNGGFEILARLNESNIGLGLIFLIGLLASFHCVGMCGGLVITYSTSQAANEKKKIHSSHVQYNLGRLISYTVIGAILGGVGSFFGVNPNFSGMVMILAGVFMILMGVNLFTHFKILDSLQFRMPQFVARFLYKQRHTKKPKGPLVIGLLNGFMPCGPLQAMQLYALGTGSITRGALSMFFYALGTVPLMFGFGAFISALSQKYIGKVMKVSAVLVAILGLIMFNRGLINFGLGVRGLIPRGVVGQVEKGIKSETGNFQTVRMDLTYRGYDPNVLYVKAGAPVRWIINVKQMSGCTDEIIMPDYNIRKKLQRGENVIEFTPTKAGEIKFSCWMQMVWGKFIVE